MALFELRSWCVVGNARVLGVCLVLGACILLSFGCARGPDPVALEIDIDEDTKTAITLVASATVSNLEYHISSLPKNGAISGTPPNIQYTPSPNFFGTDEFEYSVSRGGSRSFAPAKVSITVTPVNDPPKAEQIRALTEENTPTTIPPQAVDVDGQVIEFEIVDAPKFGTAEMDAGEFRYTPRNGFYGNDSFDYVAIDELGLRSKVTKVTISVTLKPMNELASTEVSETPELSLSDQNSTLTETTPSTAIEAITSTNSPDNTPPEVEDREVLVREDSDIVVNLEATDVDGTVARYGITTLPAHGALSGSDAKRTYSPNVNFTGADSFAYIAIDDQGGVSTPAVVSITVDPINDIPIADSSTWITSEDSSGVYVELHAEDIDGSIERYLIVDEPAYGTIEDIGSGRWLYVPDEDFSGLDSFRWVAIDNENGHSSAAMVSLTVSERPDPPKIRLRRSHYQTTVGGSVDIRVSVSDPDNDASQFDIRAGRDANGRFRPSSRGTINDLSRLRFEATTRGIRTYIVEVSDSSGLSAYANFTVEVINTAPVVNFGSPSYDRSSGKVNFRIRVQDPDGTIDHFVIQTIDNRRADHITVNGANVTDSETFTIDGPCESEVGAWCTLNVTYVPDVVDGHSRRIRMYAVDDEGASSPKDFLRIETRALETTSAPLDEDEESLTGPPVTDEDNDELPERNPDDLIIEEIDREEIEKISDPNRTVPRRHR